MTYAEYLSEIATAQADHPEWRVGQTAMNVLRTARPDLYRAVSGRTTDVDPFFINDNLDRFHEFVRANW